MVIIFINDSKYYSLKVLKVYIKLDPDSQVLKLLVLQKVLEIHDWLLL